MRVSDWADRLSPRERAVVAAAGAVITGALVWSLILSPYLEAVGDRRAELARQTRLLRADRQLLARRDAYRSGLEEAAARVERLRPRLLDGPGAGLAAAQLAQLLQDRAGANRVLIRRREPGPVDRAGPRLVSVSVAATGESDLEGILSLLGGLDQSDPLVRLRSLEIERASRTSAATAAEVLRFRLVVEGLAITDSVPDGTGAVADSAPDARPDAGAGSGRIRATDLPDGGAPVEARDP